MADRFVMSPGKPGELELLLTMLDEASKFWLEIIEEFDDEAFKKIRDESGRSISKQVVHICAVEDGWINKVVLQGERAFPEMLKAGLDQEYLDDWKWAPASPWSKEKLIEKHKGIRAHTREVLKGLSPGEHLVELRGHKVNLRWILFHLIEHEAYHSGQIQILSEMN
jgi:uncharacterized damage-inducible protein DinB